MLKLWEAPMQQVTRVRGVMKCSKGRFASLSEEANISQRDWRAVVLSPAHLFLYFQLWEFHRNTTDA